jgi:hypothetical protein
MVWTRIATNIVTIDLYLSIEGLSYWRIIVRFQKRARGGMVDTLVLGTSDASHGSSSLSGRTTFFIPKYCHLVFRAAPLRGQITSHPGDALLALATRSQYLGMKTVGEWIDFIYLKAWTDAVPPRKWLEF